MCIQECLALVEYSGSLPGGFDGPIFATPVGCVRYFQHSKHFLPCLCTMHGSLHSLPLVLAANVAIWWERGVPHYLPSLLHQKCLNRTPKCFLHHQEEQCDVHWPN